MVKNGVYSFLGFWGSFGTHGLLAFAKMPWRSKRARCSLDMLWENSHSPQDLPEP